ncbi:uncharacterized protein VP01_1193g8 [Puccinia sorghi]|uniref:Uncharacterized protein n=1 Tax=Puccinia sorghi TaxID=27349 RepID=A0A0L6VS75_9BASI|nr:uncharacterized protein VP01_1193g8 [Puccinia sorghi]
MERPEVAAPRAMASGSKPRLILHSRTGTSAYQFAHPGEWLGMNAPRRIESSNLMVGAAVSMFEVTTLGQPLEVLKTHMAAHRDSGLRCAIKDVWSRGGGGGIRGFYQDALPRYLNVHADGCSHFLSKKMNENKIRSYSLGGCLILLNPDAVTLSSISRAWIESSSAGAILLFTAAELESFSVINLSVSPSAAGFIGGCGGGIAQAYLTMGVCTTMKASLFLQKKIILLFCDCFKMNLRNLRSASPWLPEITRAKQSFQHSAAAVNSKGTMGLFIEILRKVWARKLLYLLERDRGGDPRDKQGRTCGGSPTMYKLGIADGIYPSGRRYDPDGSGKRQRHRADGRRESDKQCDWRRIRMLEPRRKIFPIEVVRIEMQSMAKHSSTRPQKLTIMNTMAYIYKGDFLHPRALHYGFKGLFKGVLPRMGLSVWRTVCFVSVADMARAWWRDRV